MALKHWSYFVKDYVVGVNELPNGQWIADMRLKPTLDQSGASARCEVFSTVREALRFVGFPVDYLPLPKELN